MTRRRKILLAALGFALALTTAWSCQYMSAQRSAAVSAQDSLTEGLQMIGQIEVIRHRPTMAAERERGVTETTSLVEGAAREAGIGPEGLRRIAPEAPRRMGESVYKEKPTRVLLQSVTLKQLVALASAPALMEAGLSVESLRLSAPPEGAATDVWNVEMVLTYLVFDPPQPGK